jgi:cytosine/adenosine deaminase-related metal-dependent hydrolase
MIIRARLVVTMDGPPIENGAVAISGDRIVDVGIFDEVRARGSGEVIDLGEQALLPGLINAHCHLDYTCLRGKIPRQKSFTDWIRVINAEKARLSLEDYVTSIKEGFVEAKRFGTTAVANLTGFPELIATINAPIRTCWFAELIDVREPARVKEIVDIALRPLKSAKSSGLAPHAPFTASAGLYQRCEEIARDENRALTTHLAESREEMEMFRDARGPLYDFMKEIGRDMSDCGGRTPLAHFINEVHPRKDWIVAHLNELSGSDLELLRASTKFSVVHCPRSHAYFAHSPFQFQKLRDLGFNICLGTDSLASNEDLSLFAEMRQFQQNEPGTAPEEILSMVTSKAGPALGEPRLIGRIRSGHMADLIAIPFSSPRKTLFEEILAFGGEVTFSMVDGRALSTD